MRQIRRLDDAIEILDGDFLLSRTPRRAEATHTLLDVMAAIVHGLAPPAEPLALLGFGGGGLVAPLRGLGWRGPIAGVDLDPEAEPVFREASVEWAGEVAVALEDAVAWLEAEPGPFSAIVDDLSTLVDEEVAKPYESVEAVPRLASERLADAGVFVSNLLPWPDAPFDALIGNIALPFADAVIVTLDEWENRILVGGRRLPAADDLEREVGASLSRLGSREADRFHIADVSRGSGGAP